MPIIHNEHITHLTKSEFANCIGVSNASIGMATKSRDGRPAQFPLCDVGGKTLINLSDPKVREWVIKQEKRGKVWDITKCKITTRRQKKEQEQSTSTSIPPSSPPAPPSRTMADPIPAPPLPSVEIGDDEIYQKLQESDDVDTRKKQLQCDEIEKKIEKISLDNDVKKGKLLPANEVGDVLRFAISNYTSNAMSFFNNQLGLVVKELGGDSEDYNRFSDQMLVSFEHFGKGALEDIVKGIEKIIEDNASNFEE